MAVIRAQIKYLGKLKLSAKPVVSAGGGFLFLTPRKNSQSKNKTPHLYLTFMTGLILILGLTGCNAIEATKEIIAEIPTTEPTTDPTIEAKPSLSVVNLTGEEGDSMTVLIELSEPVDSMSSVEWELVGGTATLGQDILADGGTIVFEAGQTSFTIVIPLTSDSVYEASESFYFRIKNPYNMDLSDGSQLLDVELQIMEDPLATKPQVSFTVASQTVLENASDIWWDSDWTIKRVFTIDNSAQSETLTDFPILVKLDASRIDYSAVQSQGQDLRFVDPQTNSQLDHEIEVWNANGISFVWVKVPSVAGGAGTELAFYYGNNLAPDGQNAANVWSNGYNGVWHLNQDPSGTTSDSTASANDGSAFGAMNGTNLVSGISGQALTFDGNNDYISIPASTSLDITTDKLTVSAWTNMPANFPSVDTPFLCNGPATNQEQYLLGTDNGNTYNFRTTSDDDFSRLDDGTLKFDEWVYVVGTYDGTLMNIYENAVAVGVGLAQSTNLKSTNTNLHFGKRCASDNRYFTGQLDEIRVSNQFRSEDWIKAQYLSIKDNLISTWSGERTEGLAVKVTAQLDLPYDGELSVPFSVSGSSLAPGDFATLAGTITIPALQLTASVIINLNNDLNIESDETLQISIDPMTIVDVASPNVHTITIVDDDGAVASFGTNSQTVAENVGTILIPVNLANTSLNATNIDYTVSGTALAPGDHDLVNGTLTILAGQTTANISVTISDDAVDEFLETIIITLDAPSEGHLGKIGIYEISIAANDGPEIEFALVSQSKGEETGTITVTVNIGSLSPETILVPYTVTGTTNTSDRSIVTGTFSVSPNQSTFDLSSTQVNDTTDEVDETIIITLGTPSHGFIGTNSVHTVTVQDNDNPPNLSITDFTVFEGNMARLTVSLDNISGKDITFDWSTADGTAVAPGDYFSENQVGVLFPKDLISFDIYVQVNNDVLAETSEAFTVVLSNETNVVLADGSSTITIDAVVVPIITKSIGATGRDFPNVQAWEDSRQGNLDTRARLTVLANAGTFIAGELVDGAGNCNGTYVPEDAAVTNGTILSLDDLQGVCTDGDVFTGATSGATATFDTDITAPTFIGTIEKGEMYSDAVFDEHVLIAGSLTSDGRYMWLTVAAGHHHLGVAGAGVVVTPTTKGHVYRIQDSNFRMGGFEITGWLNSSGDKSWEGIRLEGDLAIVEEMLIHSNQASYYNTDADAIYIASAMDGKTAHIRNSLLYNISRGAINNQSSITLNINIENVTAYNTGKQGSYADSECGFHLNGYGRVNIVNSMSLLCGSGTAFNIYPSEGYSSNNISSDASAVGTSAQINELASNIFVDLSSSTNPDLQLQAGSVAVDTGVLLGPVSLDIKGTARPQGGLQDIGAYEF